MYNPTFRSKQIKYYVLNMPEILIYHYITWCFLPKLLIIKTTTKEVQNKNTQSNKIFKIVALQKQCSKYLYRHSN